MRDHTKLRAFQLADLLALDLYKITCSFPKEEQFGLTSQIRRGAVSVASNIVEGCARNTEADYVRFLIIAFGSLKEVTYQLSLAWRLKYISEDTYKKQESVCKETIKVLAGLIRSFD